jgi:acid stress chaperone HdeA
MTKHGWLVLAVVIGVAGAAGVAQAKKHNLPKMTCEEFLALGEDLQPRAVAWLDGYSKGGKLKEEDLGEVDVDRQVEVLVVSCKEDPKKTLWDKIQEKLPGASKRVKPVKMTCEDFVALTESERPELYYFAKGYNRGSKVKEDVSGEVDLEKDTAVVYQECKQAPKESFWAKVKKHF